MKGLCKTVAGRVVAWVGVGVLVAAQSACYQANAQTNGLVTLVDKNSTVLIDPLSDAGMSRWLVDNVNQLAKQWFWYRADLPNSPTFEQAINTISVPAVTIAAPNRVTTSYANALFGVDVSYVLTGNTFGSGKSGISETIRLNNFTGQDINFHFFEYSDFNLAGVAGGQDAQIFSNLSGLYRALQTMGPASVDERITSYPAPTHAEAALYNVTLAKLTDALPTTLSDALSAGPGDVTFAFQWDVTLYANSSFTISKLKTITIPEPSAVALGIMALLAAAVYRRKVRV